MKEWLTYAVVLLVTAVFSFYLTGIFNPFVRYEVEATVPGGSQAAWSAFTDTSGFRQWWDGVEEVHATGPESVSVGTSYHFVLIQDGETYELSQAVTAVHKPDRIEYRVENDILINDMRVEFISVDSSTRIRVHNKVSGKSFFWRAVFTIFKFMLVDSQQADMERFTRWMTMAE